MKFAFIEGQAQDHDVAMLCRVLGVSRSGFYDWRGRQRSPRAREDNRLKVTIRAIHQRSRATYGAPRIHAELLAQGERISHKRVARLMREEALEGKLPRRRGTRTTRAVPGTVGQNLLNRDFVAPAPNRVWVADTTYLHTAVGWAFLVVVLDLFSRRVVGFAVGDQLNTELAQTALKRAVTLRCVEPGLIVHTDRGGEFTSMAFKADLANIQALQSLSYPGQCYDNAAMESFFGILKDELDITQGRTFESAADAERFIAEYIENFYNQQRRHSTIDYASHVNFEIKARQVAQAA